MAEVRICFEVDFEYCEIGFIHGSRVLREPLRRRNSSWIVVGSLLEILLPSAAIVVVLRTSGFAPLVRGFLIAVLLIPWIRLLGRFFDHQVSIDSQLATSDSRLEISVRPDGWTLSTANTRAEHRWDLVARVVRFDAGFVVVENWAGQSARWLPLSGFESTAAANQFVELLRGAAVAFEDRRPRK